MHRKPPVDKKDKPAETTIDKKDKPPENANPKVAFDILDKVSREFLDDKAAAKLAGSATFFRKRQLLQSPKRAEVWEKKLTEIGVNPVSVKKVIQALIIQDYESLYKLMLKMPVRVRGMFKPWELFCFSGEIPAIKRAIKVEGLHSFTKGAMGPVLSTVACSGKITAIKFVNDEFFWVQGKQAVFLSFVLAARFGTANEMRFIANMQSSLGFLDWKDVINQSTPDNDNAFVQAAAGGSVENMRCAAKEFGCNTQVIKNEPGDLILDRANALIYAAASGSIDAVNAATNEFKLPIDSTNALGMNAFHVAAYYGYINLMQHLIDKFQFEPAAVAGNGANALQFAAYGGVPESVVFLRSLGIDPNATDNSGRNALWYANQPRNHPFIAIQSKEQIVKLLTMPLEEARKSLALNKKEEKTEAMLTMTKPKGPS